MRPVHISPSSINTFKACPFRFRLAYVEGLRKAEDNDSQRVGSAWHLMHEAYSDAAVAGQDAEAAFQAAVEAVQQKMATRPAHKTEFEWELERAILVTCFTGYHWYYQNEQLRTIATEIKYDLPIHMPRSGMPIHASKGKRVVVSTALWSGWARWSILK